MGLARRARRYCRGLLFAPESADFLKTAGKRWVVIGQVQTGWDPRCFLFSSAFRFPEKLKAPFRFVENILKNNPDRGIAYLLANSACNAYGSCDSLKHQQASGPSAVSSVAKYQQDQQGHKTSDQQKTIELRRAVEPLRDHRFRNQCQDCARRKRLDRPPDRQSSAS